MLTVVRRNVEEVRQGVEQVFQEVIPVELQQENFSTAMCNAGCDTVNSAENSSDYFSSIMSVVKDITSQSTEELIRKKFNKFVVHLHDNLKRKDLAQDLVDKFCKYVTLIMVLTKHKWLAKNIYPVAWKCLSMVECVGDQEQSRCKTRNGMEWNRK